MKSVSLDAILCLIYMRTQLELAIEYDSKGYIKKNDLSFLANRVYLKIVSLEKAINLKHYAIYRKAIDISKKAYPMAKDALPEKYTIYIQPIVAGLYFSKKKDMKAIGFNPVFIDDMMNEYFFKYNCDLENESYVPVDKIWEASKKVVFDMKKEEKRLKP